MTQRRVVDDSGERRASPTDVTTGGPYAGKSVLLTGGYGFVGSHLAAALLTQGAQVTVLDLDCSATRPSALSREGLSGHPALRMIETDVVDEVALATVLAGSGYDVVFHLAAYSMIERSALEPQASVRTNVMGIVNLLTALSASDRQDPESIVLLSTDKVYGESGSSPTDEAAPLTGRGLYEAAKAAGDMLARTFHQTHGLPVTVVRPCNVYGPHDYGGECRLVPRALRSIYGAAEPRPPELYFGSIQHRRDFLYVGDAVEMILAVGATPGCAGEVFNLTGDTNLSPPEMLRSVVECAAEYERKFDERRAERILANGIRIELRPRKSRAVVIETQRINGDKLVRILGVRPKVTLQEGLRRTVAAFRDYFRGAVA